MGRRGCAVCVGGVAVSLPNVADRAHDSIVRHQAERAERALIAMCGKPGAWNRMISATRFKVVPAGPFATPMLLPYPKNRLRWRWP